MGVTKRFLAHKIMEDGPEGVIIGVETKEEAMDWLREQPWNVWCACDCPKDEDGACLGPNATR